MDNKIFDRTLTLTDFFKVFIKRLWIILLAVVIGASSIVALEIFRIKTAKQEYVSETILRLPQNGPMVDGSSTELSLINDFYRIIDSAPVLHTVYESIDFSGEDEDITYEDFRKQISLVQHPDSRIIKIKVQWTDADIAEQIVDGICKEGLKNIEKSLDENEMSAMLIRLETDTQELSHTINKELPLKKALIMCVGFGAAVYLLFIIIFWLDNRVREDDDLESNIGISVLGTVPNEKLSCKMAVGHYEKILSDKIDKQISEENK